MTRVTHATLALLAGIAATVLIGSSPAGAATLTQVTSFGSNPGNLIMYAYRPDGLPPGAPLVVAMHGCTQSANDYYANSGWRKYADLWGFALVFPEQKSGNNANRCFNWFESADIGRGQGEALSIRQMVSSAVSTYGLDARRVYVTGLSAGGAMTAVMLGAYPDVFAGGAVVAGIPYRCATTLSAAFSCMNPGVDKTAQQWGDLVRGASSYTGPWPRVAIWHGQSDGTVVPLNAAELRDQWTDVRGVSQTPTSTASLPGGTTLEVYGADAVRVYRIAGMGHGTPVDPGTATDQCGTAAAYFLDTICSSYHTARFFGLDTGGPAPSPTPSPTATAPVCVTASNYAHVQAGRAYHSLGYAYARGSNDFLGLYNTFTTHTLKQLGTDHWVLADGQC